MMTLERLESLQTKHANIEETLAKVEGAAYVDSAEVYRLKKEKLKIKEEMAGVCERELKKRA